MTHKYKHKVPDIQCVVEGILEPPNDPLNFSFYFRAKYVTD